MERSCVADDIIIFFFFLVGIRLLAHAGFDPRRAVQFWEDRVGVSQLSECVASSASFDRDRDESDKGRQSQLQRAFASGIVGTGHPVNEVRVEKLREEIYRWRTERERVLARLQAKRGSATAISARS